MSFKHKNIVRLLHYIHVEKQVREKKTAHTQENDDADSEVAMEADKGAMERVESVEEEHLESEISSQATKGRESPPIKLFNTSSASLFRKKSDHTPISLECRVSSF